MRNKNFFKIRSIVDDIELTQNLIIQLKAIKEEPVNEVALSEIERKKRNLIEELLLEMIKAGFAYTQFKQLYERIFSYLESGKNIVIQSKDVQQSVNRATQFLEPSTI